MKKEKGKETLSSLGWSRAQVIAFPSLYLAQPTSSMPQPNNSSCLGQPPGLHPLAGGACLSATPKKWKKRERQMPRVWIEPTPSRSLLCSLPLRHYTVSEPVQV